MIESEAPEIKKEFNDLIKKKTGIKSRFTSTKSATENNLKNEERNTKKTQLHVTFIKSMLDMKLETLGKEKTLLDQIFGDIICIIDMYDCGPANERQWEEAQNYKGLFTKEWAEETRKFTQFRDYLTQMGDKL